jgi:hypothetical protein
MTAHALSGDREKCLKAGMNDYVSKPIEPLELREVVERWMARRPLAPAPASGGGKGVAAAPVDWARLELASGGDAAFRLQLTEVFLSDCETRLGRLRACVRSGDFDRIAREAHSIKGAAANFGAVGVARLAAELEEEAAKKDRRGCRDLTRRMEEEIGRVKSYLSAGKAEKR